MTAASPFAPYKNAQLRFQVASGALTPDPNGNLRPGSAVVEVEALLEQKRDPNREVRPGVDPSSIWLEGYLVSPRPLPSIVTPDAPAAITWQGRQGRFYIEFTARNPYLAALNIDLVEQIRGYFLPGSFAVAGEDWVPGPTQPGDSDWVRVPFTWSDTSPKTIFAAPSGATIFTAQIVIQTPFNGAGAQLRLGDALNNRRLMRANQNVPSMSGEYETNPGYTYATAANILLEITPGLGGNQGQGFVLIEWAVVGGVTLPDAPPRLELGDDWRLDLGDGSLLGLGG